MYRRTGGKIMEAKDDMSLVTVRVKLSWRTVNYNGSLFGGSLFAATDPIYMIQYIELLGDDYIVWDKSANISFKKPARENAWADFKVDLNELAEIKKKVAENGSTTFVKSLELTSKDKTVVFSVIDKEIYVASKEFYEKRKLLKKQKAN